MKTQLLLIDNYAISRQGLKMILEYDGVYDVIDLSSGDARLFDILTQNEPKLILINLLSAKDHVLSIVKKIKTDFSTIPFMLLVDGAMEFLINECVINGAKGIVKIEDTPEQLIEVIEKVINGEVHLNISNYLKKRDRPVIDKEFTQHYKLRSNKNGFSVLSDREIEVVKLFAEGKSYKVIADRLNISPRTVESHKKNILAKLNINTIVDLAKFALKNRLID